MTVIWGGVVGVGMTTSPEAVTRVGAAGVGGEKRERDKEGMEESKVCRGAGGEGAKEGEMKGGGRRRG